MGKRSNFDRIDKDFYPTPKEAVRPLISHLGNKEMSYTEPCAGNGDLVRHLCELGGNGNNQPSLYECSFACDVEPKNDGILKRNALTISKENVKNDDYIITNPPWSRHILHPMIDHFRKLKPTWLLFDAGWMFTKQARPYLQFCETVVAVGRVKWIPDSKYTGKDDCCWYLFKDHEVNTRFINN